MQHVLRAKHAAEYLGVGISTFWRWVKNGRIPPSIHLGNRVTVWRKDVLEQVLSDYEAENNAEGGRSWKI